MNGMMLDKSEVGRWATTTKEMSTLSHFFEKGSKVRIIGVSDYGYDLEDEYGNCICGIDFDDVELIPGLERKEVLSLLEKKINDVFWAYQKANGIESGDISPEDAFSLDELQEKMVNLIIGVCEKNRVLAKETVERD